MIRKKCMTGLFAASALAVVSSGVPAQPVNQSVNSSIGVNSNTQFKAMPRSNVTITPGATAYPGTSTTRVESRDTRSTRNGGALAQRSTVITTFPTGRSTATATFATDTAMTRGAQDRNANSPGKGWAKGKVKQEQKHKNKRH